MHLLKRLSNPFLVSAILLLGMWAQTIAAQVTTQQWTGHVQCQLAMQSGGYAYQEVQTWKLTGDAPSSGGMQVYPATWSVNGQGDMQQTQGVQILSGRWNSSVPTMSAPIAIFVRASDQRLIIKLWHSQLVVHGGVTGVRQSGTTQTSINTAAYEWPLPAIEDVANSTSVSGSGTSVIPGNIMPMQSPSASGTANCTWQFSKGSKSAVSGPATVGIGNGSPSVTTSISAPTATRAPTQVAKTPPAAGTNGAATGGATNQTNSSPMDNGNHTFNAAFQLAAVRGDIGSDVDNKSASWIADNTSDFYAFHIKRTVQSLAPPTMSATLTISGLQSDADFDVVIYAQLSTGTAQLRNITYKGSNAASISFLNSQFDNGPDIVVELHARKLGPYQLTLKGNNQQGTEIDVPNSTSSGTSQTNSSASNSGTDAFPAAVRLGGVRGDTGSDVINKSASWQTDNTSDFYTFHLTRAAGSSLSPGALVATLTVSGMQADADYDLHFYTQAGGGTPFAKFDGFKGSNSGVFCFTNYNMINGPDVVIELRTRKQGPYQLMIAGDITGCPSSIDIPKEN